MFPLYTVAIVVDGIFVAKTVDVNDIDVNTINNDNVIDKIFFMFFLSIIIKNSL